MAYTTSILNEHVDPAVLYLYTKTEPTANSTSHVIVTYMPQGNMPTKLDVHAIYAKYLVCI